MGSGIRAEVSVDAAGVCPIASTSDETGAASHSVSRSVGPAGADTVTEEFVLDAEAAPDGDRMEAIFEYGSKRVYRFDRPRDIGCPCECVEQFDCPIVDVSTRDGRLYLSFHATDVACLQEVLSALNERFGGADVRRIVRSDAEDGAGDLVFVDRGTLTDRQREVLETAHGMGYFEHPKRANAGEIADALGITTSTFTEHLAAAQRKLLGTILDTDG